MGDLGICFGVMGDLGICFGVNVMGDLGINHSESNQLI